MVNIKLKSNEKDMVELKTSQPAKCLRPEEDIHLDDLSSGNRQNCQQTLFMATNSLKLHATNEADIVMTSEENHYSPRFSD